MEELYAGLRAAAKVRAWSDGREARFLREIKPRRDRPVRSGQG